MIKNYKRYWIALVFLILHIVAYGQVRRALLIGISDYESYPNASGWNNINGKNDVMLLGSTLKKQGFTDLTYLTDSEATYKNILLRLDHLAQSAQKGDIIYFHFSGHGQPIYDLNNDEGGEDMWDESIIPYDAIQSYDKGIYEGEHHITDDLLSEKLNLLRKKVGPRGMIYAVLDACYSGTGSRDGNNEEEIPKRGLNLGFDFGKNIDFKAPVDRNNNFVLKSVKGLSDIVVLEACQAHQENHEIKENGMYYGPLSYYINKVMQTCDIFTTPGWVKRVKQNFKQDKRTFNQNIVCESSIK